MFIVLGESLIDLVAQPDGSYAPVAGGAPYNFARALALQGVASGYLNAFSEDVFGILLQETLLVSGARHLGCVSPKPTSLALVATDANGQPRYSFYRSEVADRDLDESTFPSSDPEVIGFHTGGLALVPPDHEFALAALRRYRAKGATCTADLNLRPQVARSMNVEPAQYRAAALAVAHAAHVVKVSDEDLHVLGYEGEPRVAARALLQDNCRLVVLTLGAAGAWAICAEHELFEPAAALPIVDTIGAGDCFFAGFVAALQHGAVLRAAADARIAPAALRAALAHATRCAAINISRKGCAPPTWDEALALG